MISAKLRRPGLGPFREYQRNAIQRAESAALIATDRASNSAKLGIRQDMAGAGLGRLGLALGSGSDLRKNGRVHRYGQKGFSASGWIYTRSRSERSLGALKIYSEGGDILPVTGKWEWIATKNAPKRIGRYRTTPALYLKSSLVSSIGPLVFLPGRHPGEAQLVVKNVSTRAAGNPNPRRLPRSGRTRAGREAHDFIVMFIGIKRTSRTQRFSPIDRYREQQSKLPSYWYQAMGEQ
jgi:hypothetical protein